MRNPNHSKPKCHAITQLTARCEVKMRTKIHDIFQSSIAYLVDVISEFNFIVIQSSIDLPFAPCIQNPDKILMIVSLL
jgi:hypothetical protein